MTYFLDKIASHLYDEYGDNLDSHCLVFPNRRAGLYFLKYLAGKTDRPVWAPQILTINELFQSFSTAKLAESELLVFELYKIYRKLNKNPGSIDDFFFWGEMVLNDFDDVDKYLADAAKLYINLKDIREIDVKFGGLTQPQVEIIRQFWVNFNPDSSTTQKSDFQELWSVMLPLYDELRETLLQQNIAYEGMIYRELAEKCIKGELHGIKWEYLHFIGFNALNNCEKTLLTFLKNLGKAKFYWDYDNSFVSQDESHSAGYFIRENLKLFGNDMPPDWEYNRLSAEDQEKVNITVIDSSSDIAQVKMAKKIVEDSSDINSSEAHHTSIVLTDENLLLPVLSSLPENADSINVTMGYPLKFSPVYSLIRDLLLLQKSLRRDEAGNVIFPRNDVIKILTNSFFTDDPLHLETSNTIRSNINKELWIRQSTFSGYQPFSSIFCKIETAGELSLYLRTILEKLYILADSNDGKGSVAVGINIRNEFIYRVILAINRLEDIISDKDSEISVSTYNRLLDRILKGLSIPFSGEPLNGIQIMGILETRALDFKNLIILSVSEGTFPKNISSGSFIPYNLREAFGLPTIRHQDSIYAYYFYRLIQRAENVTLLYNSSSDGIKTGEMSRFILQLKYSAKQPMFLSQRFEIMAADSVPRELPRSKAHIDRLGKMYLEEGRKTLSPSCVNTWLTCRMKFYYRYICGLKEPEKLSGEIDSAVFGELLHRVMEKIYSPVKKKIQGFDYFDSILKDDSAVLSGIEDSINAMFYTSGNRKLKGIDLIISKVLKSYIRSIIKHDTSLIPIEIVELEHVIHTNISVNHGGKDLQVRIGGIIDRLDRTGMIYRITDYKTGKIDMEISSLESLFDESYKNRNDAWFQILMYCYVFRKERSSDKVKPAIYPVRSMQGEDFSDSLVIKDLNGIAEIIDDFEKVNDQFGIYLKETIEKMMSHDESFRMTENSEKCGYCPFSRLCQK